MNRFKAHGDFEGTWKQIAEPQGSFTDQSRMRFYDHVLGECDALSDGRIIRVRNRRRVEETAAVVEFHLIGPNVQV